jgi:PAS domain S-box-containing protein
MYLLYVEDDPLDADLTRRELAKSAPHIQLDIARTQKQALEFLDGEQHYDLLLTDLRLPDGGGFSLLTYVRELGLPMAVVVITGQGDEETAVSVLKAGADDYVVKRQDYLSHLAVTLMSALQRYQAEIALRVRPLRVLYAEQNPTDIDLTIRHFHTHAPHIHLDVVRTLAEVLERLSDREEIARVDALMLDYRLHSMNALEVVKQLRQTQGLDMPIVLVTRHGDEEIAAQALRLGANDYVVKSPGYLYQLPGLLENAYHHTQVLREQIALQASEKRFRALIENSAEAVFLLNAQGVVLYASPSISRLLGYETERFFGTDFFERVHPDDLLELQNVMRELLRQAGTTVSVDLRIKHQNSSWVWVESSMQNSLDEPAVRGIVVNARNITERKLAEERIYRQVQRLNALRTVDMAITTSLDLRITLAVLLEHVISQLNVHAADILLLNPNSQMLVYSAGRGFRFRYAESARIRLGDSYAGRAALDRHTISIPDLTTLSHPSRFASFISEEGFAAYYGTPLIAKGQVKGVLEVYHRSVLDADPEWLGFYETLAGQAAIAIDNTELFENLQRANLDLTMAYDITLEGWVKALDLRDQETEGHTQRVAEKTIQLAYEMGFSDEAAAHLRRGALLHDIGKIAVSDNILLKPGPLTEEEWAIILKHPEYAFELLAPIEYLRPALDIPYCHHEKWDGTGYPRGLKGEQIPLGARIFAVVDVWDALSYDRPYRNGWEKEKVLDYIRSLSGTHFDPKVVDTFLSLINAEEHSKKGDDHEQITFSGY